jgi:lysophospholipase L1-like esterase
LAISLALSMWVATTAHAQTSGSTCSVPSDLTRLNQPLDRVARKIAEGSGITIVALGSSSTAGAGASTSAASYPSRLEAELTAIFPHLPIRVLNRGVGGEEMPNMLARLDKAVIAEAPDLVLWQLGTNSVLRGREIDRSVPLIHEGLARMRAIGADVVLIDPQFAPKVIVKPDAERMVELIAATAKAENIDLFHRFGVMRYWHNVDHVPFADFLSSDGLHMNDWSYACVAKLLAGAIVDAATRTVQAAHTHSAVP